MRKPRQNRSDSPAGNPEGVSSSSDAAGWARIAYFVCVALAAGILAAWAGALFSEETPPPGLHVSYALGIVVAAFSAGIVRKSRREYLAELAELDQSIETVRTDAIGGERGQLLLREMMEDVGVGWYRMSPDGRLEASNLALAVMLGFDSVDTLRTVCRESSFTGSTDRTSALSALQTLGEIRNHPASWPTASGRRARLIESARTIRDDGGRLRHIEGVAVLASQAEVPSRKVVEPAAKPEPAPEQPRPAAPAPTPPPVSSRPASRSGGDGTGTVAVRRLLENLLDASIGEARPRGLEIGFRLTDEASVRVDGDRLARALQHVLDFAVRATASGGITVHARLGRTDNDFHTAGFEVRSTHRSTDAPDPELAFAVRPQDGERMDECLLAATASRQLAQDLGGDLRVESGPDDGFSIHLSVPVDPVPDSSGSTDDLDGLVVLLLDDNEISGAFLSHQLDSAGATVVAASRPGEAAQLVEDDGTIDVIVASLSSARGAAEFVGHLKKIDAERRPPLVLVVPADMHGRSQGSRSGARLAKPVRRDELVRAVLEALPVEDGTAVSPVAYPEPPSEPAPLAVKPSRNPSGALSILVAEDDPVNGRLMLYLLEGMGHEVELVRSGDQAVSAFKERDFDAAIMDVRMPGLSGPDAARRILRNAASRGTAPILLGMTASTATWDRDACLSAGMRACLVKPMTTDAIQEALSTPAPRASERARSDRPSLPPARSRRIGSDDGVDDGAGLVSSDEALAEIRAYLGTHHAGEPAYSAELVAGFLSSAPDLVDAISDARDADDPDGLREAARSLQARCRQIGFARLSALCRTLEGTGPEDADAWIVAIRDTFDAVRPALDAEQAELAHLADLHSSL